jgi:Lon protease-like protein
MPLDIDLPDDPPAAAWALCRAAPLGPFDRQRLLEAAAATARLDLLAELLSEQVVVLAAALRHQ